MKRIIVSMCILLILIYSCGETMKGDHTQTNETEQKEEKEKVKNGPVKQYRKTGELLSLINYVDGKREGLAQMWYKNGNLKLEATYKDDCKHGLARSFYEDGTLNKEVEYKNCAKDGLEKKYWPSGQLASEMPWKNDFPGMGLKEYNKEGVRLKRNIPKIVITPVNNMATTGQIILKIKLSTNSKAVEFFVGDLVDGKFMSDELIMLNTIKGKTEFALSGSDSRDVVIIAKAKTYRGNYHILRAKYR